MEALSMNYWLIAIWYWLPSFSFHCLKCGVCGKRFTASSNLYYHRMTHNKVCYLISHESILSHHEKHPYSHKTNILSTFFSNMLFISHFRFEITFGTACCFFSVVYGGNFSFAYILCAIESSRESRVYHVFLHELRKQFKRPFFVSLQR